MGAYKDLVKIYHKSEEELEAIAARIESMQIVMPSWLPLDAGTRFGKVHAKDAAADSWEALERYKVIYELTGTGRDIMWGSMRDNDIPRIKAALEQNGLALNTVHAYFGDEASSYGSVANVKKEQRDIVLAEIRGCVELMRATGAKNLSLWFKDGTNYPGQANFTKRYERMMGVLKEAYKMLDDDMTMLVEYKLFEPSMYHTDIADWGTAVAVCSELGEKARVIMDLGHHAHGTNIPATLDSIFRSGKMGAIHFNDSKYADDDLIVGALDPYRLFLVFHELLTQEKYCGVDLDKIPFIIDQSLVVEEKMPGLLYTITNMQTAFAKALLIDLDALDDMQNANNVIGAARVLRNAFEYDVRPLLQAIREKNGLPADPFQEV